MSRATSQIRSRVRSVSPTRISEEDESTSLLTNNSIREPWYDFYQFTCGGYLEENDIPDTKSRIGSFNTLSEDNKRIIKRAIQSPYPNDSLLSPSETILDKKVFTKIQTVYNACMNESQIESQSITPLARFIKTSIIPSLSTDLANIIATSHLYQSSPFFQLNVEPNLKDPSLNTISLYQGGLNLPSKEYYSDQDILKVYKTTIVDMFKQIYPLITDKQKTNDQLNVFADKIIRLESQLSMISKSKTELSDPKVTFNPITIKQLSLLSKSGDFYKKYFELVFMGDRFDGLITMDTVINIDNPDYFSRIHSVILLNTKETLDGYVVWTSIKKYGQMLDKLSKQPLMELNLKTGTGVKVEPERWETCLGVVDVTLGDVASKWFIKHTFSENGKLDAENTIQMIKYAFLKRLPEIEWIDSKTAQLAVEKVEKLVSKIGYPDFIMDPQKSYAKYANLNITGNFFENYVGFMKFEFDEMIKKSVEKVDKSEWDMTASTVNAYYNPPLNEIVFPAGILRNPFYAYENPKYLNYGGIGAVVGHELTHAFDNNGRKFDSTGRLIDWWTNATALEFEQKAQCFVEQYGNYTVNLPEPHHINGELTLGENLADNGGIARSLEAWLEDTRKDKTINFAIAGLDDYTFEQLYFIAFGQVWCSKTKPATMLNRLRNDPHSPEVFRVNGAVSNSETFQRAFECKAGDKMNSKDKCLIW